MTQKEMVEQMYTIIVTGNGAEPLPEQVRNNRKDIGYLKDKLKNMPKNWRSWLSFIITVLTFSILLINYFKK